MKNVLRTLICEEQVSLTLVDTTEIVKRAQEIHGLKRGAAAVLGKFLSAAAYMSAALKEESGEISFALHGSGYGGQINVSGNYDLHIRGYMEGDDADGTEEEILQKINDYFDMGVDYILTDYFLSAKCEFDKRKGFL